MTLFLSVPSTTTVSIHCAHCAFEARALSAEVDPWFCCAGCRGAWHLIHHSGLANFYALRAQDPAPDRETDRAADTDAIAYDHLAFIAAHVRHRHDGLAAITWHVAGMHCAACVWLLENLPRLDTSIRQARVQFATAQLTVVYDPIAGSPRRQATLIAELGYQALPLTGDQNGQRQELRSLTLRTAVAAAAAVAAMQVSMNLYAGELSHDLDVGSTRVYGLLAMITALPAVLYSAVPLYRSGYAALRSGRFSVDATATLTILIASIASVTAWIGGSRALYADAVSMFIALLLGGRLALLSIRGRLTRLTGGLGAWLPLTARRIDSNNNEQVIATEALTIGDRVAVHADVMLPCDGILDQDSALIDCAVLTGESRPITMVRGQTIHAGGICRSPFVMMRVSAIGTATRIGQLWSQACDHISSASPAIALADRLQGWLTPIILVLALATGAWWWNAPTGGAATAVSQALAVILVSCPCAFGLATPLVQALAIARAAARGLVIQDATALDVIGDQRAVAHVVFDKTGTLTEGRMRVVTWRWHVFDHDMQEHIRGTVAAAEARSQHPLAIAIGAHLDQCAHGHVVCLHDWKELHGQGIACRTDRGNLRIGNARLTGQTSAATAALETPVMVTWNDTLVAEIAVADALRVEAIPLVRDLHHRGVTVHILSGDAEPVVQAVAEALQIPRACSVANASPEDKATYVRELSTHGRTLMIGDGVNDAAALAEADVGIALRGGLPAALRGAAVFIARGDGLSGVRELFAGARCARSSVRSLLIIAMIYNALGITLAATGVWGPYLCAVAMPLSSLTVIIMAHSSRAFVR